MACALAPTWASFLVFRLFTGIFGSAIVALGPGILADIYQDPKPRGWSIAVFMGVCIKLVSSIHSYCPISLLLLL